MPLSSSSPSSESFSSLLNLPLHHFHMKHQAMMMPFAGYHMPLSYEKGGVMDEYRQTRQSAGLFDISHMGQLRFKGGNVVRELERILPSDLANMKAGEMVYSLILNEAGGIIDDVIISCWDKRDFSLVINAANKAKTMQFIDAYCPKLEMEEIQSRVLLALQGPKAAYVLEKFLPQVSSMFFMQMKKFDQTRWGDDIWVSRSGYTGEDGFEISAPHAQGEEIFKDLIPCPEVKLCGLGSRDLLRLEAGLCLYGQDIDRQTNPIQANLDWVIPKRRWNEANFLGAKTLIQEKKNGPDRLLMGWEPQQRMMLKKNMLLVDIKQRVIGKLTSAAYSPLLKKVIAMGYLSNPFTTLKKGVFVQDRNESYPVTSIPLPFRPTRYVKKNKSKKIG